MHNSFTDRPAATAEATKSAPVFASAGIALHQGDVLALAGSLPANSIDAIIADPPYCSGGTVLDPFAGSSTTLVAATLEGRKGIGFELSPEYCEISIARLRSISEKRCKR